MYGVRKVNVFQSCSYGRLEKTCAMCERKFSTAVSRKGIYIQKYT